MPAAAACKKSCMPAAAGRYPCRQGCGILFTRQDNRARHERHCTPRTDHLCRHGCGKSFARAANLDRHELTCRGPVPACAACGQTFMSWAAHSRHDCGGGCQVCGRVFASSDALARHEVRCGQLHMCRQGCGKTFVYPSQRRVHEHRCRGAACPAPSLDELTCSRCALTFASARSLQRHLTTCGLVMSCRKGCGADFSSARARGVHERDCTYRKRTLFCSLCVRKGFWTLAEYEAHARAGVHDMPTPATALPPSASMFNPSPDDWCVIRAQRCAKSIKVASDAECNGGPCIPRGDNIAAEAPRVQGGDPSVDIGSVAAHGRQALPCGDAGGPCRAR